MSTKRYAEYHQLGCVQGLAFRHFSGEEDYQVLLDLWNRVRKDYKSEVVVSLEFMRQFHRKTKNNDIYEQMIIVEKEDSPIGYFGWHWDIDEYDNKYILATGIVLAKEYWDTPIPKLMMEFQEEKVIAMTDHLTDIPRVLQTGYDKINPFLPDLFASSGYEPIRYFFEVSRPIEVPVGEYPMPEGLEIREVKPEHYRKIWNAHHEAFKDHWGYSVPPEGRFEVWQEEKRWFQPHLWKIAWDGEEVAGQVKNFIDEIENKEFNRRRAYTEGICVGRKWRGRGLAKALIAESIRMFQQMGDIDETAHGVDSENPSGALKLYTSLGYVENETKTHIVTRKKV